MPGTKTCVTCDHTIEGQSVTLEKRSFHPECFICFKCRKSLKGKAVHIHEGNNYDPECFSAFVAFKCDICFAPIAADNSKFLRAGDKTYHVECYVCTSCNKSLQGVKYINEGTDRMCETCMNKPYSK